MIDIIWLFLFLIIVLITFSIFYFFREDKTLKKIEEFKDKKIDYTTDQVDVSQRAVYGVNRCSIFELDPLKVDPEIYLMSRELIETNRLKEIPEKNTKDTTYCYLYNDKERSIKDFILSDNECSIKSKYFDNNNMIKNVFVDSNADKIHTFPMNKCVIEIDNKNVTPENLSKFFNNVRDNYCTSLATDIISDIRYTQDEYTKLSRRYADIDADFRNNKSIYTGLMKEYDYCITSNNLTISRNNYIINSNNYVVQDRDRYQLSYSTCSNNLNHTIESTIRDVNELKSTMESLDKNNKQLKNDNNACALSFEDYNIKIDRRKGNAKSSLSSINNTYQQNINLISSNNECLGNYRKTKKEADDYLEKYNRCYPDISNYYTCSNNCNVCMKEKDECSNLRYNYYNLYQSYYGSNTICQNDLKITIEDLDDCTVNREKQDILNQDYKAKLIVLENEIIYLTDEKSKCIVNLRERKELKSELDNRTIELRSDKDYYKTSQKDIEKEKLDTSLQLINTRVELSNVEIQSSHEISNINVIPLVELETINIPTTTTEIKPYEINTDPYYFERFDNQSVWYNAVELMKRDASNFRDVNVDNFLDLDAYWIWSDHNSSIIMNDDKLKSLQSKHNIRQFQQIVWNNSKSYTQITYSVCTNDSGILWFNYNDYAIHNKNIGHNVVNIDISNTTVVGTYMLKPGLNTITINAINSRNEGGILFSMKDSKTNQVLLRTDSSWRYHYIQSDGYTNYTNYTN